MLNLNYIPVLDFDKNDESPFFSLLHRNQKKRGVTLRKYRIMLLLSFWLLLLEFGDFAVVQTEASAEMSSAQQKEIQAIIQGVTLPPNTTLLVSIHDFETEKNFSYNGTQRLHPASVIKTFYMLAYLEEVKKGTRNLSDVHILTNNDKYGSPGSRIGGSGRLQQAKPGTSYTWGELLELMISISDNVATNLFIADLGKEHLNQQAKRYGLLDTNIVRKIYQRIPGNTHSTANDMNQVLIALYSQEFTADEGYLLAIELMKKSTNKSRIGKYPPADTIVANKAGTLSSVVGDSALVFFPNRKPIALTIFVVGNDGAGVSRSAGDETTAKLAKEIMRYFIDK